MDINHLLNEMTRRRLNDSDDYHEVRGICLDYYREDPELLIESMIEALSNMPSDSEDGEKVARYAAESFHTSRLRAPRDTRHALTKASLLSAYCGYVGEALLNITADYIEQHVDHHLDDWVRDAATYKADMEEGQREDYEYERMRDRKMEEAE